MKSAETTKLLQLNRASVSGICSIQPNTAATTSSCQLPASSSIASTSFITPPTSTQHSHPTGLYHSSQLHAHPNSLQPQFSQAPAQASSSQPYFNETSPNHAPLNAHTHNNTSQTTTNCSKIQTNPSVSSSVQPFPLMNRTRPLLSSQTVDSSATLAALDNRRKTFRARASLGVTVASAPSVDKEEYRTPAPDSSKFCKSFDYGACPRNSMNASDNNALVTVSADFLRLNGSRQQFRNLLSARKKLGKLPPAYTKIDFSHDSLESAETVRYPNPMIKVEETGSQLKINPNSRGSRPTCTFQKGSLDRSVAENGGILKQSVDKFKRLNSRYGVPVDVSAVKMVYRIRSERLKNRVNINDVCLYLATVGILIMIIDNEVTGQCLFGITKFHPVSLMLRIILAISSALLVSQIIRYHINEIRLEMVDCGADDWRVVITWHRVLQFLLEILLCSICPLPYTGNQSWTFMENTRLSNKTHQKEVPVDILLSLLMIGRVYLVARHMVLHSKQFQDASTRTLAALNRIQVNFSFVMKSMLQQHPLSFITAFTLVFWVVTAWTFVQCERYGRNEDTVLLYSNAMWFIAITFMLNGYGDIVPYTHVGRIIAIIVGVVGAIVSSIMIAVISKKILLSQGQNNVNNFMEDSRLTRAHEDAAARVLQHTWHIHKCWTSGDNDDGHLRRYQRKFLRAIHYFRHIKNKLRSFNEVCSTSSHQVTRLVTEMHASMQKLVVQHEELREQLDMIQRAVLRREEFGKDSREGPWLSIDSHDQNLRKVSSKNVTRIHRDSQTPFSSADL